MTRMSSIHYHTKKHKTAWYIERQYKWLEADLAAANANRTEAPW